MLLHDFFNRIRCNSDRDDSARSCMQGWLCLQADFGSVALTKVRGRPVAMTLAAYVNTSANDRSYPASRSALLPPYPQAETRNTGMVSHTMAMLESRLSAAAVQRITPVSSGACCRPARHCSAAMAISAHAPDQNAAAEPCHLHIGAGAHHAGQSVDAQKMGSPDQWTGT